MDYASIISGLPETKEKHRTIFNEMIACKGLYDEIYECREQELVELLFEKYGYLKAPIKVRTLYLAWVMGYAKDFDDEGYMERMMAHQLKVKLKERAEAGDKVAEKVLEELEGIPKDKLADALKGIPAIRFMEELNRIPA